MSKHSFLLGPLALAGMVCASPAFAATATASLSNVHLRVIDLDPLDGVAASVTFLSGTMLNSAFITEGSSPSSYQSEYVPLGSPSAVHIASAYSSSTSELTAGDLFTGIGPGASSTASTAGAGNRASASSQTYELKYSVAPNTLIILTADSPLVSISLTVGEFASAAATLGFRTPDGSINSSAQAYVYQVQSGYYFSTTPSTLQLSFLNLSNTSSEVFLSFYSSVSVEGVAAAVPEPTSAVLAVIGLLAIGGTVRRARRA